LAGSCSTRWPGAPWAGCGSAAGRAIPGGHRGARRCAAIPATGVGRLVSGQLGAGSQYPLQLAAALAMTIPVAIIFFVFQKYIMRTGEGAIKE
jgi:hypothetical protein